MPSLVAIAEDTTGEILAWVEDDSLSSELAELANGTSVDAEDENSPVEDIVGLFLKVETHRWAGPVIGMGKLGIEMCVAGSHTQMPALTLDCLNGKCIVMKRGLAQCVSISCASMSQCMVR